MASLCMEQHGVNMERAWLWWQLEETLVPRSARESASALEQMTPLVPLLVPSSAVRLVPSLSERASASASVSSMAVAMGRELEKR